MSALGHYLEEQGIATVAIALIRPQAENTKPPRAVWVPFELGRPLGPPSDPAFQRRVILAALGLLTAPPHRSLIVDFPEDDPREAPDPEWQPPMAPRAVPGNGAAFADAVVAELRELAPFYARSCSERLRSTVGLSGLSPSDCGDYLAAWLRAPQAESPVAGMSAALALRFAIDDLKAFALEAAISSGAPSSRQLGDWLWNDTALGAALQVLRRDCLAGDDERLKAVAAFFVPALRVPPE